jgi:hypothetical protein
LVANAAFVCPELQFFVRHGQQVFRDEVVWDVGNPVNGAEAYAVRVCADLGLGADWFDAIRAHVAQQLDDVRQVRESVVCVPWWVGNRVVSRACKNKLESMQGLSSVA